MQKLENVEQAFFTGDAVEEISLWLYTLWFATGRLRDCETHCALLCMFENSRVNMKTLNLW